MEIQFKYGDVWQHIYRVGDELSWGGNDIGERSAGTVVAYGVPYEDVAGLPEYFEVHIVGNRIGKVIPWQEIICWGDKTYKIIDCGEPRSSMECEQ